jgi:5-formyltetrahydrofolate cyclo-ligase
MNFEDKSDRNIDSEKKILRVSAEKKRQLLCRRDAQKASISIVQNFCETWSPPFGSIISAFWPFRAELDVRPLIYRLKVEGYTIALPQVVAKARPLLFREWTTTTPLLADKYGVLCLPDTSAIIEPDWLFVPLLAFDKNGYRLGYGGGFYDLTLTKLRKEKKIFAVGVAYECQLVSMVPRTKRDVRLDAVLTEGQIFNIKD